MDPTTDGTIGVAEARLRVRFCSGANAGNGDFREKKTIRISHLFAAKRGHRQTTNGRALKNTVHSIHFTVSGGLLGRRRFRSRAEPCRRHVISVLIACTFFTSTSPSSYPFGLGLLSGIFFRFAAISSNGSFFALPLPKHVDFDNISKFYHQPNVAFQIDIRIILLFRVNGVFFLFFQRSSVQRPLFRNERPNGTERHMSRRTRYGPTNTANRKKPNRTVVLRFRRNLHVFRVCFPTNSEMPMLPPQERSRTARAVVSTRTRPERDSIDGDEMLVAGRRRINNTNKTNLQ